MTRKLKIDFVSDVACPWCAVGLGGLEQALDRLGDEVSAEITFRPFELNPGMRAGGENALEHVMTKYGMAPAQVHAGRETMRARAAAVGFVMNATDDSRIYNTFDAHRLLAWAENSGRQTALKRRLLELNFTEQVDPGDHDTLVAAAIDVGLDGDAAREVLASGAFADEVRSEEALWQSRGINSVPAVVVDDRYLISGGLPPDEFERQLRAIAAKPATNADTAD